MKCPKCNEELKFDEVDTGIGIMKGNYHCDCGWSDGSYQDDEVIEEC